VRCVVTPHWTTVPPELINRLIHSWNQENPLLVNDLTVLSAIRMGSVR